MSTIDTLHFISLTSVHLTFSNGVGKMPVSSNYFRDCVKYLFNHQRLIFEVVFSTTDNWEPINRFMSKELNKRHQISIWIALFNSFTPNGKFPLHSIWPDDFVLRGVGWHFHIFLEKIIIERSVSKQWRLIRYRVLLGLILVCTLYLCPAKKMLGLCGLIALYEKIPTSMFVKCWKAWCVIFILGYFFLRTLDCLVS